MENIRARGSSLTVREGSTTSQRRLGSFNDQQTLQVIEKEFSGLMETQYGDTSVLIRPELQGIGEIEIKRHKNSAYRKQASPKAATPKFECREHMVYRNSGSDRSRFAPAIHHSLPWF
jgi:hypothetical protein